MWVGSNCEDMRGRREGQTHVKTKWGLYGTGSCDIAAKAYEHSNIVLTCDDHVITVIVPQHIASVTKPALDQHTHGCILDAVLRSPETNRAFGRC